MPVLLNYLNQSFCRSSGPGGQNVNKLNTKVELRFMIDKADWLPDFAKIRLQELRPQNISKGEFIVISQATRTQEQNVKDALQKL